MPLCFWLYFWQTLWKVYGMNMVCNASYFLDKIVIHSYFQNCIHLFAFHSLYPATTPPQRFAFTTSIYVSTIYQPLQFKNIIYININTTASITSTTYKHMRICLLSNLLSASIPIRPSIKIFTSSFNILLLSPFLPWILQEALVFSAKKTIYDLNELSHPLLFK